MVADGLPTMKNAPHRKIRQRINMRSKIAVIMAVLLGTLCPFQVGLASNLFYVGDVFIDSVSIRVEADDEATVNAVYILTNRGSEHEEIDLQFAQSPVPLELNGEELGNPVVFRPGERKSVNVTYYLNITGETTKTLSLDPTMLFNGKPNSVPAKALVIEVLLPEGISGLVWANQQPDEEGSEDGRRSYSWSGIDVYPTPLSAKWSTLQVELGIEKTASPQEITTSDQIIVVEMTIENKGETAVDDIAVVDQCMALDFEALELSYEFGKQEPRLLWRKNINSLASGEIMTLAYSVKYTGFSSQSREFYLEPCVVTVGGHLVSLSNKVRMSQTVAATPAPTDSEVPMGSEAETLYFPSLPLLGGIILILAIARGGYFIWRRRHPR